MGETYRYAVDRLRERERGEGRGEERRGEERRGEERERSITDTQDRHTTLTDFQRQTEAGRQARYNE